MVRGYKIRLIKENRVTFADNVVKPDGTYIERGGRKIPNVKEIWFDVQDPTIVYNKEDFEIIPMYAYEIYGLETPKEWYPYIKPILDYVEKYNIFHPDNEMIICQIKEKFGYLCVHISNKDNTLKALIRDAEKNIENLNKK